MNTQDNSLPKMKVVYGISRWTNASRAAARHIDDGNGKPLCGGRDRKVFSWERDEDVPTCSVCIRVHNHKVNFPQKAHIMLDSWAGRSYVPVEIVGETPKRYRVKLLQETKLPSRKIGKIGDEVLVPKSSIKIRQS